METPAAAAEKCPHYGRRCHVLAECCKQWVGCRLCHDDKFGEQHQIDRFAIRQMRCDLCQTEQPVRPSVRPATEQEAVAARANAAVLYICVCMLVRARVQQLPREHGRVLLLRVQPLRRQGPGEEGLPLRPVRHLPVRLYTRWGIGAWVVVLT